MASRHCRGNGSGAVGWDTIVADREDLVQRRRRWLWQSDFAKVCDADASNTECRKSRARGTTRPRGTHVYRHALAFCRRQAVVETKNFPLITRSSFALIHWLQAVLLISHLSYLIRGPGSPTMSPRELA